MDQVKNFIKKNPIIIGIIIVVIIVIIGLVIQTKNNTINETMTYSELIEKIETATVDSIELSANGKEAIVTLKSSTTEKKVAIPSVDSFMEFVNEKLREGIKINFTQKK